MTESSIQSPTAGPNSAESAQQPEHPEQQLHHLLGGYPVVFCRDEADLRAVLKDGGTRVHEASAAIVNGSAAVVRASVNPCCAVTNITKTAAEALGLKTCQVHGGGIRNNLGRVREAVEVVLEPVEIQLLFAPNKPAITFNPALVLVIPAWYGCWVELQLGLDFFTQEDKDMIYDPRAPGILVGRPGDAGSFCVPYILPKPRNPDEERVVGTSTFKIAEDTLLEAKTVVAAAAAQAACA